MEKIKTICRRCSGSGIAVSGQGVVENPCIECNGAKYVFGTEAVDLSSADDQAQADIAALDVKIDAIIAELDYIHGKVTAIWNQVKP